MPRSAEATRTCSRALTVALFPGAVLRSMAKLVEGRAVLAGVSSVIYLQLSESDKCSRRQQPGLIGTGA